MGQDERLRRSLTDAIETFDSGGASVAALARKALRIAALRHDAAHELWLSFETVDWITGAKEIGQHPSIVRANERLTTLVGKVEAAAALLDAYNRWERNRTIQKDGKSMIMGYSLGHLEVQLKETQQAMAELVVPANLTPIDTYRAAAMVDRSKASVTPQIYALQEVLNRSKSSIYEFLIETERQVDMGQVNAGIFERSQAYVNARLAELSPDALQQFVSAQERIATGGSEDLSQALGSCRRMIKSLADALYPATGEVVVGLDGVERTMDDDHYRNRLTEFVRRSAGKSTHSEVLGTVLRDLGSRLTALDSLASKGVHGEVSAAEAETCVVWTYMLAADILRVADGTGSLVTG